MSLRIIGGKYKGHPLYSVPSTKTRPTQAVVREALFNICQNEIEEKEFLDCFAGSGAIGFEALSRGAKFVTFIESEKLALSTIHKNCERLKVKDQVKVLSFRAEIALKRLKTPFDMIYLDPPYDFSLIPFVEAILENHLLKEGGSLFLEERASFKKSAPLFSGLTLQSSRKFGEALLHHYT